MKKITILAYLVLGGILFQASKTLITPNAFANTANEKTHQLSQNSNDFTYAAEKSIEAVVHIRSKYIEDEY